MGVHTWYCQVLREPVILEEGENGMMQLHGGAPANRVVDPDIRRRAA
jgi:hypothetical protein